MKIKATKREMKKQKNFVLGVGYCAIYHILKRIDVEPTLYNEGVYGLRCDFYPINEDLGIVTGYNVDRACDVAQWELNKEFNDKLQALEDRAHACKWGDQEEIERLENDFVDLLYKAKNGEFAQRACKDC